ncbi:hypothetical protein C8R45DRAFT_1175911 [Mycena sanguinolenta]|nr:hypothetical protein C8R45DRAFT_1175911 [Mycena sanguinolenta]
MAAAQAAAQGRNFPVMIRSYLFVRRACGSVSAGNEKGRARAPPTPRDRPPPRRPLAQTQEVRADAYGRRPRIRSGAARVDEGARSAPHRACCAHSAGWERVVSLGARRGHRHSRVSLDCERGAAGWYSQRIRCRESRVWLWASQAHGTRIKLSGGAHLGRRNVRIRCAPCEFHAARQPTFIPRCSNLAHCLPPSPSSPACRLCSSLRRSPPPCSLLAHHAPGIAHNHLAAVHAPTEPPPLATPAVLNVARREEQDASATVPRSHPPKVGNEGKVFIANSTGNWEAKNSQM